MGRSGCFAYRDPRPGLRELGIANSSLLFDGRRDGNVISGTAYVFAKGCEPAPYSVTGNITNETSILLVGAAPRSREEWMRHRRLFLKESARTARVQLRQPNPVARLIELYWQLDPANE